jgi:hypothetical protein
MCDALDTQRLATTWLITLLVLRNAIRGDLSAVLGATCCAFGARATCACALEALPRDAQTDAMRRNRRSLVCGALSFAALLPPQVLVSS